ncbi:hypothetical protein [Pantoea vagans]|jgi:hypothetical protein|uniref:hypothetical protein n=1 Tax=Pantoea vagans TaxID=470934 RepID=UPI0028984C42|nr:hypothetical protein [Pantoea vagans]
MNKYLIAFFIIITLILGLTPLFLYFIQFSKTIYFPNISDSFSYKNDDWASFGSYISGTSGAIFSFFGTLAVVWTLLVTHKSSERQINMLRTEQTFSQFNELLKILTNILEEKKYPIGAYNNGNFNGFKSISYETISNLFNEYLYKNPRMRKDTSYKDIALISTFHDQYMTGIKKDLFKKEAAIFSILLEKIICSDFTTREALIAILNARLDEDYYFFFHCQHLDGSLSIQLERMVNSGIPMRIPSELSNRFLKNFP